MPEHKGNIEGCAVSISIGNMVKEKAGAYLVPQFDSEVVFGGVAGAIANNGAHLGVQEFADYMDKNGPLEFGTVWPTKSYGGNADWLLHAVSVSSGKDTAFDVIRKVTYEAMKICGEKGIGKLVLPALGTGILRELSDDQSAKAMLSGIHQYASEGGKPVKASFIFLSGPYAQGLFDAYKTALQTKTYENAAPEVAAGKIDMGRWVEGMQLDQIANEEFARKNPISLQTGQDIKAKPIKFKKPEA